MSAPEEFSARWFPPTFGDRRYLGSPDSARAGDFADLKQIALAADASGFEGVLILSGRACEDSMDSGGQRRMSALQGRRCHRWEVAPNLWAGVGLVRGGDGTALVGDADTVEWLFAPATRNAERLVNTGPFAEILKGARS